MPYITWGLIVIFSPYAFYLTVKIFNLYRIQNDGLTPGEIFVAFLVFCSTIFPFWNFLLILLFVATLREEQVKFIDVGKIKNWKFFSTRFFKP